MVRVAHIPDMIVDYRGDMTLLIHEVKKAEEFFLKDGNVHDSSSTDNSELNIVQTIIKHQLESLEADKWNKVSNTCMSIYEDTSTVVHHLYTMEKTGTDHKKLESMIT